MAKSRTKSLFHFTKTFKTLCSILEYGFWPRYSLEDISWISGTDFDAFPIVCFCDIPISRLTEHTDFYGRFGIGMRRKWGISECLNPVMYVSKKSHTYKPIRNIFENPDPEVETLKADIIMTLAHMKPLTGKMKRRGKVVRKDFYEECEWRFLDVSNGPISHAEFNNKKILQKCHQKTKKWPLTFDADDIRYLLVPNEKYVPELVDFIGSRLNQYSSEKRKLLGTRIIALNRIIEDI